MEDRSCLGTRANPATAPAAAATNSRRERSSAEQSFSLSNLGSFDIRIDIPPDLVDIILLFVANRTSRHNSTWSPVPQFAINALGISGAILNPLRLGFSNVGLFTKSRYVKADFESNGAPL